MNAATSAAASFCPYPAGTLPSVRPCESKSVLTRLKRRTLASANCATCIVRSNDIEETIRLRWNIFIAMYTGWRNRTVGSLGSMDAASSSVGVAMQ